MQENKNNNLKRKKTQLNTAYIQEISKMYFCIVTKKNNINFIKCVHIFFFKTGWKFSIMALLNYYFILIFLLLSRKSKMKLRSRQKN